MPSPSHSNAQTPQIAMESSSPNQKTKTKEDDADFNPLMQETPSPEASSSISSEAEPDAIPAPISIPTPISKGDSPSNPCIRSASAEEEEEETVMQSNFEIRVSEEESLGQVSGTAEERRNGGDDVAEDAICRRTRARYSLANFTLDELETFLQETDDEDDLTNVDDEEEYRKFLAAVLLGNDGGGGGEAGGKDDDDDDDEENDADFEVEIEEALMESDGDEGDKGEGRSGGRSEPHRPETRQKKRQKDSPSSVESGRKLLGQAKIPLRPLLPSVSNSNGNEWPRLLPESVGHRPPSLLQSGQLGFTASQIGQLHCLIHEHVQLLVQVYTLCIFDSSRRDIGSDAQRMLLELVSKRDESLAWRKNPHPGFCFRPPYVQSSVSEQCPRLCSLCSSDASDVQEDSSGMNTASCNTTDTQKACATTAQSGHRNFYSANVGPCPHSGDSIWKPVVRGPLKTILDVAPLSLVSRYVTDVSAAIQEFNPRGVGSAYGACHSIKEPLFPFPLITIPNTETNNEVARGPVPNLNMDPSHSTGQVQHQPKKSLAATLVESTKKQSYALVPREIVKLAQRFFPLFNSALFPHKPPPPAVANRVLFTDAEDGLLAMGLMEYNNDWKAIQQRFLPCKTKHQIFVRQKNRSSSKAPENPIKAVRRMKTSPLTGEEQARIHEGLKVYKLDWISIWKLFVPYRDPSLLPRQWRIAQGTQKSYKTSEAAKAKRRLYESMRRKSKKDMASWQTVAKEEVDNADGGDNSEDGNMDDEDEAYVHEAFLAWTPRSPKSMSSEPPVSNVCNGNLQSAVSLPQHSMQISENWVDVMGEYGESEPMHDLMTAKNLTGDPQRMSQFICYQYSTSYTSSQQASNWKSKPSCSLVNLRSYRMRKRNIVKCVKLAPDLPPVNLPPSVRVISQSAFKSYQCESSFSRSDAGTENLVSCLPSVAKSGFISVNAEKNRSVVPKISSNTSSDPRTMKQPNTEEAGTEPDLQMHPLLFQSPEDGCLPYSAMNNSSSSTFSFFLGTPLHTNLDPVHESQEAGGAVDHFHPALRSKEAPSNQCTIDFHPLLKRADDVNYDPELVCGTCVQTPSSSNSTMNAPMVIGSQLTAKAVPNSIYEKANELDLDIHLSSSASMEVTGERYRFEHRSIGSSTRAREHGTIEDNLHEESWTRACSGPHVLDSRELTLSSNGISRFTENNLDQQSNPEIVMEQEELSDSSEEDVGDDVEFEREEMADSEGEGPGCRQLDNLQNKESPIVEVEEEGILIDKNDHSRIKLTRCDPQKNVLVANSNTHYRDSALTTKGKNIGSSKQSNSGSHTLGLSSSKLKCGRRNSRVRDASIEVQSRSGRSSKRKFNVDGIALHLREAPELCLNPATAECNTSTCIKNHRKRGCRTNVRGIDRCSSRHFSGESLVNHPDNCGKVDESKMPTPTSLELSLPKSKEQMETGA